LSTIGGEQNPGVVQRLEIAGFHLAGKLQEFGEARHVMRTTRTRLGTAETLPQQWGVSVDDFRVGARRVWESIEAGPAGSLRCDGKETGQEEMQDDKANTEAARQYETAHLAHYKSKDLSRALTLYQSILTAYPDTQEAKDSRTQLMNIASSVVPKQELLDAQVALARNHLDSTA
jgi:hypothetical protein